MTRILITTSAFAREDCSPINLLQSAGYEVILNPYGRKLSEEEVVNLLLQVKPVGMIAGVESLTARVLEQAEGLKVISRCGIGLDNVDLNAARSRGIAVLNTPDAPTQAVAELTVGVVFDLLRRISFLDRELRRGNWRKETGSLLQGKRVGIVGLGRIGKRVAELLLALGAKVAGTDIRPDFKWLQTNQVPLVSLEELLKESEILCLHLSYAPDNEHLIGKREIEAMRKGVYLINLSRGDVVDEDALYLALTSGHLSGAALDVFDQEPYTGPLAKLDNVILTPHIGSYARESRLEMEMQAVKNLLSVLNAHKYNDNEKHVLRNANPRDTIIQQGGI
ncbi:phosphoglycerate dehydrogenase [Dehalococcoidia bacterium]|nr:phosphoglycerate dehydrogenase [Dehalococcoidia bacterium]